MPRRLPERLLAWLLGLWAVSGALLAAYWDAVVGALWVYALGFWGAHAFAGAVLLVLAIRHRRDASSRAVGVALVAAVPIVAAALWFGAGLLRAAGDAVSPW